MKSFGIELVAASISREGQSFRHHFKPTDNCKGGHTTVESCNTKGLVNATGYDCSGLVVASVCDVFGIPPSSWPMNYRHAVQMASLALPKTEPSLGDIVVLASKNWTGSDVVHTGLYTGNGRMVHASGVTGMVVESPPANSIVGALVIPVNVVHAIASSITQY